MSEREGRLRTEYREWYPTLEPEAWYPAAWLSQAVLAQLSEGEPRWHAEKRVLCDTHFSFRGGEPAADPSARKRRTDEPTIQPG